MLSCQALCGAVAVILIGELGVVLGAAVVGIAEVGAVGIARRSRHREVLEASAPTVADRWPRLASGTSTAAATQATAEAMGVLLPTCFNECVVQFNLGEPRASVETMSDEPSLVPIARAILRSGKRAHPDHRYFYALQMIFGWCGEPTSTAAKTVGVKAVGPLGTLFPTGLHVARSSAAHRQPHLGRTSK